MRPALQLFGQRFGRLVVTGRVKNRKGYTVWACMCDCGTATETLGVSLASGNTLSCGCLLSEVRKTASVTHAARRTKAYASWAHMRQRCGNKRDKDYPRYGGRGITVCERWEDFVLFLEDMGQPPTNHTLDRVDNDGPYSPENCRWASRVTQRRNNSANIIVTIRGESMPLADACARYRVKHQTAYTRLRYGWTAERALGVSP